MIKALQLQRERSDPTPPPPALLSPQGPGLTLHNVPSPLPSADPARSVWSGSQLRKGLLSGITLELSVASPVPKLVDSPMLGSCRVATRAPPSPPLTETTDGNLSSFMKLPPGPATGQSCSFGFLIGAAKTHV